MAGPFQVGLPPGEAADARTDHLQWVDPPAWPVAPGWQPLVKDFWSSGVGQGLQARLIERLQQHAVVYPPQPLRALELCGPESLQVVILGQDPYHGPGQAEGLAFSVAPGVKTPPSLRNMFVELGRDLGIATPVDGSLVRWARQGVLLLNTCLTVDQASPASHAGWGWEALTDRIIDHCSRTGVPKAFLLWGGHAQQKARLIDEKRHLVLRANHPSPLSARRPPVPFIGCGHFGAVNRWLREQNRPPVDW